MNDITYHEIITRTIRDYGYNMLPKADSKPNKKVLNKQADFTRLLLKTPLEKYTQQLWEAFMAVACDELDFTNILTEIEDKARSRIDAATKLAKQLLAIFNNEPVKAGKTIITSHKALEAIKQILIDEYKAFGMHQRQMTIEEAEADLKDWRNNKDTEEWIREQLDLIADEYGCAYEEGFFISDEDLDAFCTDPSNAEYYAEGVNICEEVTPEQVEEAIRLNTNSKKAGKKVQNTKLHWLILEIRSYYKRHRNEDYRLIFDCMDLFGLIDEAMKKNWDKYDPKKLNMAKASYIKSLYKQAVRYEPADTQQILVARFKGIRLEFHDTL